MNDKVSGIGTGGDFDTLFEDDTPRPPKIRISAKEFLDAYRPTLRPALTLLAILLPVTILVTVLALHMFATTSFTAEMTVAPNRMVESNNNSISGGLSSLVGLSGPTDSQFDLYLSTRKSNLLAARLMAIPGLPQRIFMGMWDEQTHQWRPPPGAFAAFRRSLTRALGFTPWSPPTGGDLGAYLSKAITVTTDKRNLLTKIDYSNGDQAFAKSLLMTVHNEAENILRAQAQQRTAILIDHIVHELSTVTVTEQRQALIELLTEQEKQLMMISKNLPYAAVVVDPPSADLPDSRPRPLLTIIIALAVVTAGTAAGFAALTFLRLRRAKRNA